VEEMLAQVERVIGEATQLTPGQEVVLIAGFPIGAMRAANFLMVHDL
jgi:hypothetical protein